MACYITAKVSDVMQCIGRENQEEYMEYKGLAVGNTIKSLRIKKNVSVFELQSENKSIACVSVGRRK